MFSNGAACVWSKSNTKTAAASLLVLVSMNRPFQVCFPFGKRWPDEYFVLIMWVEQGQRRISEPKAKVTSQYRIFPKSF